MKIISIMFITITLFVMYFLTRKKQLGERKKYLLLRLKRIDKKAYTGMKRDLKKHTLSLKYQNMIIEDEIASFMIVEEQVAEKRIGFDCQDY